MVFSTILLYAGFTIFQFHGEMTNMTNTNNDAQIRYWKSGPGSNWAGYQQGLDACFENINQRLVELCNADADSAIVDVGCGAGATSIALARAYGNQVKITGIDVSTPLLEHARNRVESEGLNNIQFLEADAQVHDFTPGRFDRLVSRFGVMFFSDPALAFRNLAAAIKPGGKMSFIAWADVNQNPWFQLPLEVAITRLGKPQLTDPREPGPMAFSDLDYLTDILDLAGFANFTISVEENSIVTRLAIEEMAQLACNLGPVVRLLKDKNGNKHDAEAIQTRVVDEFKQFQSENRIEIPAKIVIARASF
jgi:SAM-dependent methyltransferase